MKDETNRWDEILFVILVQVVFFLSPELSERVVSLFISINSLVCMPFVRSDLKYWTVFRIHIQLNPDPYPAKNLNPDPNPEDPWIRIRILAIF